MNRDIKVFKSKKKSDTYVFVDKTKCFSELPEGLQSSFGPYELVLEMALSPSRKLARVSGKEVLAAIESIGFYLQLPPGLNEIENGQR